MRNGLYFEEALRLVVETNGKLEISKGLSEGWQKETGGWEASDAACLVLVHKRFLSRYQDNFSDFMLHAVKGPHNERIIRVVEDSPACPGTGQMGTGPHGRGAVSPSPIMVLTFGANVNVPDALWATDQILVGKGGCGKCNL